MPFDRLWPMGLAVIAALIPLASYVCVINDITDESEDRLAHKPNRMTHKSRRFKAGWLSACCLGGILAAAFGFDHNKSAQALYLANWLAFTLYSVPPIRLKTRGAAGVIADACGGQLLPSLWTAALVWPHAPPVFWLALAVWAGALGLRGILAHQAGDVEADRQAGVPTLAVKLGLPRLTQLVHWGLFPIEILGLSALLWLAHSAFALPLLALYALAQLALWRWLAIKPVIAIPTPRCRLVLWRYYQLWFPLTFVFALALRTPWALICLPAHVVLFPDTWRRFAQHCGHIRHRILTPTIPITP